MSFWKFYDKLPYWDVLSPESEQPGEPISKKKPTPKPKFYSPPAPIVKLVNQPGTGRLLAALDVTGKLALWDSRKRRKITEWTSEQLHNQTKGNSVVELKPADMRAHSYLLYHSCYCKLMVPLFDIRHC